MANPSKVKLLVVVPSMATSLVTRPSEVEPLLAAWLVAMPCLVVTA